MPDMDVAANEPDASHDDSSLAGAPDNVASPPSAVEADAPTAAAPDVAAEPSIEPAAPSVDAGAAQRSVLIQAFRDFILGCTAPILHLERWSFLGKQDGWLRIDMAPVEFLEVIKEQYPAELLVALGLCEYADDELLPAAGLEGDAPLFVEIKEDPWSFRFRTGSEFLFPMIKTARNYALARIPPDSPQTTDTLFVVASQEAAEILHSLGLVAVTFDGLNDLGCEDVERLFASNDRSDCRWRYYIVLLDFDMVRLDNRPVAAIGEVIQRLADAADVYDVDPAQRFAVCRPSAQDFHVLERSVAFKDAARIRRQLESMSAAAKSTNIQLWQTHFVNQVVSFSAARQALARALQRSDPVCRRAEVRDALSAYREAGRQAVMEKFNAAVDSMRDPFTQVDLIAALECAEQYLNDDPLVRAAESVLADETLPSDRDLYEEMLTKRQRSLNELRRIRREIRPKR